MVLIGVILDLPGVMFSRDLNDDKIMIKVIYRKLSLHLKQIEARLYKIVKNDLHLALKEATQ